MHSKRKTRPSRPRYGIMRAPRRRRFAKRAAIIFGVVAVSAPTLSGLPLGESEAEGPPPAAGAGAASLVAADASVAEAPPTSALAADPRVRAFLKAYGAHIDSVSFLEDDAVFHMAGAPIHFRDGRMLDGRRSDRAEQCDPIFYEYPLGPLTEPPPPPADERPTYCQDVAETLWGRSETEIRRHGRSVRFLDHRMFVNTVVVEPLAAVEQDLLHAAAGDREVAAWIDQLSITYSFISRDIAGSDTQSQHGFGLAVDFVPRSYDGRAVYWRWSRVLDRQGWFRIPLEERWSPPASVVETFERHGFVWGGKWARFDAMHFEYRPEILGYARLVAAAR